MKVPEGKSIVIKGRTYKAGDDIPAPLDEIAMGFFNKNSDKNSDTDDSEDDDPDSDVEEDPDPDED